MGKVIVASRYDPPSRSCMTRSQGLRKNGKPVHRTELLNESDHAIIEKYGSEYRGIVQYYAYARNRFWFDRLHWTMSKSLLRTLAAKHKSTVAKMARRFTGKAISKNGVITCLSVTTERQGRKPLYAQFGGISLSAESFKNVTIEDIPTDLDRRIPRNELINRLQADVCELCGSQDNVQVHHIRKLSDLKVPGRKEKPTWIKTMAADRDARPSSSVEYATLQSTPGNRRGYSRLRKSRSKDRVTGEPCALKVASTVRRGADGKGIAVG